MLAFAATLLALAGPAAWAGDDPDPSADVTLLPLSDSAWAGSSVNVLAGIRSNLFSDGDYQFAAFYDGGGRLVLARRRSDEDRWLVEPTAHVANATDAHNHVALAVDGGGFLHVAWDHHNSVLQYARSRTPFRLDIEPAPMLGDREKEVTYPQFHRLPDGRLLFLYRDGGSGRGALVVNRYDPATGTWSRLQDRLVDGEGERSAYWDAFVDARGTIHIAWNWRESPDVASNHDIVYARSTDGGEHWQDVDGREIPLPMTAATSRPAWTVPRRHNLMNPPTVTADASGRPLIASYWSDAPRQQPRFRVLWFDGARWRLRDGPATTVPFSLSGAGTRHPPVSRAVVFAGPPAASDVVYLVYRDDGEGGAVMLASLANLAAGDWRLTRLVEGPLGGWEPGFDPGRYAARREVHMLLQAVGQVDGRDDLAAPVAPTALRVLALEPDRF